MAKLYGFEITGKIIEDFVQIGLLRDGGFTPGKEKEFVQTMARRMSHRQARQFGQTFETEVARVRELDGVRDVLFGRDAMVLRTSPIEITAQGIAYAVSSRGYVVAFRAETEARNFGVDIFNLDGPNFAGYQHPHVHQSGMPCLGNISGTVETVFQEGELAFAADLILRFLRSYTPGHQLGNAEIETWPRVRKGNTITNWLPVPGQRRSS